MYEVKRDKDVKKVHNMKAIKDMFDGKVKGDFIIEAIQRLEERQRREKKKKK